MLSALLKYVNHIIDVVVIIFPPLMSDHSEDVIRAGMLDGFPCDEKSNHVIPRSLDSLEMKVCLV
jgi:hypothetical protein